jgi:hypothetical protein
MSYDLNDNDFNPLDDFALNEPVADKKPNKVPVAFRVPQDVKDWIEGYAIYEGCYDISQFMNKLIKEKMDVVNGLAEPDYMKSSGDEQQVSNEKKEKINPFSMIFLLLLCILFSYSTIAFIFWDLNPINWSIYGRLIAIFLYIIQKYGLIKLLKYENII